MMSHALFFQIVVYFILPLILAVIHAAVSLPLFNQLDRPVRPCGTSAPARCSRC